MFSNQGPLAMDPAFLPHLLQMQSHPPVNPSAAELQQIADRTEAMRANVFVGAPMVQAGSSAPLASRPHNRVVAPPRRPLPAKPAPLTPAKRAELERRLAAIEARQGGAPAAVAPEPAGFVASYYSPQARDLDREMGMDADRPNVRREGGRLVFSAIGGATR